MTQINQNNTQKSIPFHPILSHSIPHEGWFGIWSHWSLDNARSCYLSDLFEFLQQGSVCMCVRVPTSTRALSLGLIYLRCFHTFHSCMSTSCSAMRWGQDLTIIEIQCSDGEKTGTSAKKYNERGAHMSEASEAPIRCANTMTYNFEGKNCWGKGVSLEIETASSDRLYQWQTHTNRIKSTSRIYPRVQIVRIDMLWSTRFCEY